MDGMSQPDSLVFNRLPAGMETTDVVAKVARHKSVLFPLNRLPEKFAVVPVCGDGNGKQTKNQAGDDRKAFGHLQIQIRPVDS